MLTIGQRRPLKITQAAGLAPTDAKGTATLEVEIATRLKLPPGEKPADWNVKVDLNDGAIRNIRGRRVDHAQLAILARPGSVSIDGHARIDGVKAELAMVEPFGEGALAPRRRQVRLRLDRTARRALGLRLEDYLTGPVDAAVEDLGGGMSRVSVDLGAAAIAVPTIAWSKGKGVPARAEFELRTQAGRTTISNLTLAGRDFSARGKLSFDAQGVRSADLPHVRLNANNSFSLQVKRHEGRYEVDVLGAQFDLRALMRRLMKGGTKIPAGGPDLRLAARFATLRGFHDRVLKGVTLSLDLRRGEVRSLDFRAVTGRNAPVRVSMEPTGRHTGTRVMMSTADAGDLLAFADLYTKMRGGRLEVRLNRDGKGIFAGKIEATQFTVLNEPRLRLLADKRQMQRHDAESGRREVEQPASKRSVVKWVRAQIRRGPGFLTIRDGQLRGGDMAAIFAGTVYDRRGRMAMKGTFLPAYGLNRALSNIPVLGYAMGNGRKRGLLGITFRLRGATRNPRLEVNPISLLTPGVLRRIFE